MRIEICETCVCTGAVNYVCLSVKSIYALDSLLIMSICVRQANHSKQNDVLLFLHCIL